jgi:hypothetical protein
MKEFFIPLIFLKTESQKPKTVYMLLKKCTMKKQLLLKKQLAKATPLVGLLAFGSKNTPEKPNQTVPNFF